MCLLTNWVYWLITNSDLIKMVTYEVQEKNF